MQDSIPLIPCLTMRLPMSHCMHDTCDAVAWWGVHRMLLLTCTYFSVFSGAVRPFRRAPALWDHLLHLHPAISHKEKFAQCRWMGSKPPPRKRDWEGEFEYSVTGSPQDVDMENLCNWRKDRDGDLGPALKSSFSGPMCTGLVAWFPVWSISRTHVFLLLPLVHKYIDDQPRRGDNTMRKREQAVWMQESSWCHCAAHAQHHTKCTVRFYRNTRYKKPLNTS